MSSYKARIVILDSWTKNGHCPICSHSSIRVIHGKERQTTWRVSPVEAPLNWKQTAWISA